MNWLYFDIETLRSAEEVGGWRNIEAMGIACTVTYSSRDRQFRTYREHECDALIVAMQQCDAICGFNSRRFDLRVLQPHVDCDLSSLPHLDLMLDLKSALGFAPSLNACSRATLDAGKSSNGLESLQWWRDGREDEVIAYCRDDVDLTRRLHEFGAKNGSIAIEMRGRGARNSVRNVEVDWSLDALHRVVQGSLF